MNGTLNPAVAREKIGALRRLIAKHERLYFVENRPEISDFEFDSLMSELKSLETQFPEFSDPGSPTNRVGGIASSFDTVRHRVPMLSIDNSYSMGDIADWIKRITKIVGRSVFPIVAELKIDGVSATLHYNEGRFLEGATRGDGETGDLVTGNLKTIRSLPLEIQSTLDLDIRGEVFVPKSRLDELNRKRTAFGEDPFKNCRNLASGTLKSLDPQVASERGLQLMVYGIAQAIEVGIESHYNVLNYLKEQGFMINRSVRLCADMEQIENFIRETDGIRNEFDFDIDGIVLKVDDLRLQQELGTTAKAPRWALAFKFAQQQAITRLNSVIWQVGRSQITPVAILEPVELGGTTVSRASLHNLDQIREKDIRIGDSLIVEKAGYIIPYVVKALPEMRNGAETVVNPPSVCPSCGEAVIISSPEIDDVESTVVKCSNVDCIGKLARRISHFVSQMGIENIGPQIVDRLITEGLVNGISGLLHLTVSDLMQIERMGQKLADKIIGSIDAARKVPMARLIAALGIENAGEVIAQNIAYATGNNIDELVAANIEKLISIPGINEKIASNILIFFKIPENACLLEELKAWWLGPDSDLENPDMQRLLDAKTFVITGEASVPRRKLEELVKATGGRLTSSVSAKTDYLVIGSRETADFSSTKKSRAQKLNIPIIDEYQLVQMAGVNIEDL